MRKRSECHCSCHAEINGRPVAMHIMACCEPDCPKCDSYSQDWIDRKIYHDNGHVWPGFAGEPDGADYGGSDF